MHSLSRDDPRAGDVILSASTDGSRQFTLGTSRELPQITYPSQERALAHAIRFARAKRVDVWSRDAGEVMTRVWQHGGHSATRTASRT